MRLIGVYTAKKKDGTEYFRASFTYKRKHISLGSYNSCELAHNAYLEAVSVMNHPSIGINDYQKGQSLSFEKWVILNNLRDHNIYFSTPIYIRNKYFSYFIDEKTELKFSIDDLFYYSSHKIMKRKGHFFVSDYGMQITILNRYGIKTYAVLNRDYRLRNNDPYDFRYENIEVINSFHGVKYTTHYGINQFQARLHIKGNYIIGYYPTAIEAAIAYNKAIDICYKNGLKKQFLQNDMVDISPSQYAEIYHGLVISDKIINLKF